MIRTAEDVMAVARARGFKIMVKPGPPPMPVLWGDATQATPVLLDALKAYRLEIIAIVQAEPHEEGKNGAA